MPKTSNQIFFLLHKQNLSPPPLTAGVVVESKQQPRTDESACAAVRDVAGETADEGAHSASAVLGKIPATMNFEFLEMLIENILDSSSSSATRAFTLELLPDISSAVVTFQSEQGKGPFMHQVAHKQGSLFIYVLFSLLRDHMTQCPSKTACRISYRGR